MRLISRLIHKQPLLYLLLIMFAIPEITHADLIDDLKEDYQSIKEVVSARLNGTDESQPAEQESATAKGLPTDLPSHWSLDFVTEPVFKSRLFKLETGLQHKQTILLVHGLGQTGFRDWMGLIPDLEKSYHVIAIDLPGFGLSARPDGRYSPTNYAKVLHWLVGRYAKGKAVVIGHSMGGAVSLRYAASYPQELSRLILVDVAGILERTAFVKHLATIPVDTKNYPKFVVQAVARFQDWSSSMIEQATRLPDPTLVLHESNTAWNALLSDIANANAALSLVNEDFTAAIKSLTLDTHIIWGGQDIITPLRTGKMLDGQLSNSSLYIIDGAAHVPMRSHKQQFNRHLLQVLNNQWSKAPVEQVSTKSKGDLYCRDKVGKTYQGHYELIIIDRCEAIKLNNVTASKLIIRDSLVTIENSHIESGSIALLATGSMITATNVTLKGETGIYSQGSRLDLAGTSIKATEQGIKIAEQSRLIISVSDLTSPLYQGDLHGAYSLMKTTLDERLTL